MALNEVYAELQKGDELNAEKILNFLLTSDKNLSMKTHILNPLELSILETYAEFLETRKLKKSAKLLKEWIRIFKENMVSYKRMSREEITKTLSAMKHMKTNVSLTEKLLGMRKE
jgi:hypothetical protein